MTFSEFLKDNIVFLDGGMGTLLQSKGLKPGELPERWNMTHPGVISDIHKAYFDAGNMIAFSCSEHWAEVLAGYVAFVHVKDFHRNNGVNSGGVLKEITEGDANWEKIIHELKKGGFDGYVTGEVNGKTPEMTPDQYYANVCANIAEIIKYC